MGTPNRPGKFEAWNKAAYDEPRFALLGRDVVGGLMVEEWVRAREHLIEIGQLPDSPREREQLAEARECAKAMIAYHAKLKGKKPAAPARGRA
jgi:hypothetical protein